MFTIASLRALTTVTNNPQWVDGYYGYADGGEGNFAYVSTDTTSADNGGTIIVDAAGHRWYRDTLGQPLTVKWFGAYGNGTTDDTTAIKNAMAAAVAVSGTGALFSPAGTYNVSILGSLPGPLHWYGAGRTSTIIKTNQATGDVVGVSSGAGGTLIEHLQFDASVTRTSGNFVGLNANNVEIRNFTMNNAYLGITMTAGAEGRITDGYIDNSLHGAIVVSGGGNDQFITRVTTYGASGCSFGLNIQDTGCINLTDCDFIESGNDLLINPGNGQTVASVWAEQCYFDTAAIGIAISPSGTGNVIRCRFTSCWTSSHSNVGILVQNNGAGSVDGIEFIGHHAFNCVNNNAYLSGSVKNVRFNGGAFSGCTAGSGIAVAAGVSNFSITNAKIGSGFGMGSNTDGIYIGSGASDHFVIVGNDLTGNSGTALSNGATGTHTVVANNLTA